MNKLKGRWALISGASRGIGQQVALGLAEEGCNLVIHGRRFDNLSKTTELVKSYDIEILPVAGEFGTSDGEKSVITCIMKEIGYLDILYNNAAIQGAWYDSAFKIPLEEWEKVFDVNLFSSN